MRFPNGVTNSVAFLGSREDSSVIYRGTAFLVGIPVPSHPHLHHSYLVTAAHSVRTAATRARPLCVRYNTTNGKSVIVDVRDEWFFHDDEAVDLAVIPVTLPDNHDMTDVPLDAFATDELLEEQDFGIGDEVFATGLFYFRHGKERNLPILRTGIVASMPDEPFQDSVSGLPYDAYLVELRSFGGLSGTPIFTAMRPGAMGMGTGRTFIPLIHRLVLIGVIRGHWDMRSNRSDFSTDDLEQANAGLTIVTPVQKLAELLRCESLTRQRREEVRALSGE